MRIQKISRGGNRLNKAKRLFLGVGKNAPTWQSAEIWAGQELNPSSMLSADRNASNSNKLRTYRTYKSVFKTEPCILLNMSREQRRILAKFRACNHPLAIESARYAKPKIPFNLCLCVYCDSSRVEDETHFLIDCNFYSDLRHELFEKEYRQHILLSKRHGLKRRNDQQYDKESSKKEITKSSSGCDGRISRSGGNGSDGGSSSGGSSGGGSRSNSRDHGSSGGGSGNDGSSRSYNGGDSSTSVCGGDSGSGGVSGSSSSGGGGGGGSSS
ncbi:uncharacterized protein LOC128554619 [Mercenaria mercenaria]|uniref:uncharacterized protein LOC128554619 n=1 Tax=Mercenaria mercenaria TaxID=6596 RepID=UPI00234E5C35|nr:uncharacterized protein LOC128554619 [Mercenaria mercenaria]